MNDNQRKVIIGGLLHDIGKVLYRSDDGRNHSQSGYDFLKNDVDIKDQDILDQIRYHHSQNIKQADLNKDSLAYITYIADNIASGLDRRDKEDGEGGFVRDIALESIFNILNHNKGNEHYRPAMLGKDKEINFPTTDKIQYDESFYRSIYQKIQECLKEFSYDDKYINSLLEILEATLSFVPSSTSQKQMIDISLYDHVKITAAIGSCIYEYMKENNETDYEKILYKQAKEFYQKKTFLLYSMDISGIQDFIYTINNKGALKGLRARSFYLEIMMEHLIDELLEKVELSRANLIYSGGGHAYILMANTEKTKSIIERYEKQVNQWFLEVFQTDLYVGAGYAVCSTKDLENEPAGSYTEIFRGISKNISAKKIKRYTAKDIVWLNHRQEESGERECSICRRTDHLKENDQCEICWGLEQMAVKMMSNNFFVVSKEHEETSLPLPGDCYLTTESNEKKLRQRMEQDNYIRAYSKNEFYSGYSIATKLWVGDYKNGNDFGELAKGAQGIERLGVLRADIDNLGEAFVSGFKNEENQDRYVTLSRTATFSRKLSMFFKYHINHLLENGEFYLKEIVLQTVENVKSYVTSKQLKVKLKFEPDDFMIEADAAKLKQILYNLLSNAVKFTGTGGQIEIYVYKREDVAEFIVRDNGIGIAEQDQKKVFVEFEQVDSSYTREYEGTGLGLPLVKKMVEMHGGYVYLKSALGEGTEVIFLIPLQQGMKKQ